MLPPFDEHGNLPPGEYPSTILEITTRFGRTTLTRRGRTDRLEEFLRFARPFAVRIYIDGSYITSKLAPSDVDILLILPAAFDFDSSEGRELHRLISNKERIHLDIFPRVEGRQDHLIRRRIRGWTTDRDYRAKGIVFLEGEA